MADKPKIYYDHENDIFLREEDEDDFRVYFPERHETVDMDDVDLSGLEKLQ